MAQEEMRQRLEWSMFSEPGYMSVGDEYSDHKEKRIHEIKGVRNFQVRRCAAGGGQMHVRCGPAG